LSISETHRKYTFSFGSVSGLATTDSRNAKIFRNKSLGAANTLKNVIDELSIWLYRFKHGDQKVAAISWRDHFTQCNSEN
jgi:hypothetical protein